MNPRTKCFNCKAIGKHLSYECPIKCSDCDNNFCPGARGELCAIVADDAPKDIKNAFGDSLPDKLQSRLLDAWRKKHPGKEASGIELPATRRIAGAVGPLCNECSDADSDA